MERLYVISNQDLSIGYQAVQAGHAVAQYLLDNPDQTWNNNYLIFLSGNLEREILKLESRNLKFTKFKEPDLGNATTAIALTGEQKQFKNLKLLGN